jgi:hypothetical protein
MTTTTAEKIHLSPNTGRWESCGAEKGSCPFKGTAHITEPGQVKKMLDLQKEMDGIAKAAAAAQSAKSNPFILPKTHKYTVPSYEANPNSSSPTGKLGSKYVAGEDIASIKKRFVADVKEAQTKGYLPKGLDINTTIDRTGWTPKLVVDIRGAKDSDIYAVEKDQYGHIQKTPEAKEVEARIELLANAYRRDDSNFYEETYSTNIYTRVSVEDERARTWREDEAAREKRANAGRKQRPILIDNIKAAATPEAYFENFPFTGETKDSLREFTVLPGTQFVALKWNRPQLGGGFKAQYELYDLSPVQVPAGVSLEQAISQTKFATISSRYTKVWPEKPARRTRR